MISIVTHEEIRFSTYNSLRDDDDVGSIEVEVEHTQKIIDLESDLKHLLGVGPDFISNLSAEISALVSIKYLSHKGKEIDPRYYSMRTMEVSLVVTRFGSYILLSVCSKYDEGDNIEFNIKGILNDSDILQ